jgi:hypothetical protein
MPADIEIEVSFGATKGMPNYSSERADLRLRVTIHSTGETLPEWLNDSVAVEDQLRNHLVYSVAEALGMEAALNEGGRASLLWPEPVQVSPPPPQQLAGSPSPQAAPSGGSDRPPDTGGGGGYGPPKASKEQVAALPRVHMDFGDGLKVYIDQRPLKAQGIYAATAPDFKVDQPQGQGYWIKEKNGTLVQATLDAMTRAGVV